MFPKLSSTACVTLSIVHCMHIPSIIEIYPWTGAVLGTHGYTSDTLYTTWVTVAWVGCVSHGSPKIFSWVGHKTIRSISKWPIYVFFIFLASKTIYTDDKGSLLKV